MSTSPEAKQAAYGTAERVQQAIDAATAKLREELEELRQWKESQMLVAADTRYDEIAKEIGLTVGDYIAPAILPWIKQAKRQLAHQQPSVADEPLFGQHIKEATDAIKPLFKPSAPTPDVAEK